MWIPEDTDQEKLLELKETIRWAKKEEDWRCPKCDSCIIVEYVAYEGGNASYTVRCGECGLSVSDYGTFSPPLWWKDRPYSPGVLERCPEDGGTGSILKRMAEYFGWFRPRRRREESENGDT